MKARIGRCASAGASIRLFLFGAVLMGLILGLSPVAVAGGYQVSVHEKGKTEEGTTLFADNRNFNHPKIVEVDMQGQVVWSYAVPRNLFPSKRKKNSIISDVDRLANGNTLFVLQLVGLYEVSPEGKIVWRRKDGKASHDVDRLANGNSIYVRGWAKRGGKHVIEVDSNGKEVWSWDGMDAYGGKPYQAVDEGGWIHVNGVTRLENGNTLVSLRNFNMVAEVSPDGGVVREYLFPAKKLPLKKRLSIRAHPHDPEYQPNGNVLAAVTGANLALEVTPGGGPAWKWFHPLGKRPPAKSAGMRDVNRLGNGNTMVITRRSIQEVAPGGEIVWQMDVEGITGHNTYLYKAQRITPDGRVFGK